MGLVFVIPEVFQQHSSSGLSATRNSRLFHARGADAAQFIRFGGKTKFIVMGARGEEEKITQRRRGR
jgi:hypothetical protein